MKKEIKKARFESKISECEAQISVNEMIVEDYKNDVNFCIGLNNQINEWKKQIVFYQSKILELIWLKCFLYQNKNYICVVVALRQYSNVKK